MRFYKTQQLYMLQMVSGYLKKKKDELAKAVPVLNVLIPEFNERFEEVYKMETTAVKKTSISTLQKKEVKDELIKAVFKLVRVLRTYHYKSAKGRPPRDGLTVVRTRQGEKKTKPTENTGNYTVSDFQRASSENLVKMCKQVITDAKRIKNLRIYGLFPGDIGDAEAYLKEFAAKRNSPKLTKKEIAKRNKKKEDVIAECISFLENNIDPLVANATEGNKELNRGYFSRRKVLPRGPGNVSNKEARYRKSRKVIKKIQQKETKKA